MADNQDSHSLICALKDLAIKLGRIPTRDEFRKEIKNSGRLIDKFFGSWSMFIIASGLSKVVKVTPDEVLQKKYKSLCSKREQIQGFFRNVLDINELFDRAGNPEVLKVSAQPDTHVKFRSIPAVNAYLKFLKWYQPHVHIIMGDFIDCEGISHWPADTLEPRRLIPEIKEARVLLEEIVQATYDCSTRIYLSGNHEKWIDQAFVRMPELFDGLADLGLEITIQKLLGLEKFGYNFFPLNELVQIGNAHFTHGIYTGDSHAKAHLNAFKGANIFYGHLHDKQCYNSTSITGPLVAQSLACLCRLDAKFLKGRPNNWENGHGVFEFFRNGNFTYSVPIITDGKFSYAGVVFDGNQSSRSL